MKTRTCSYRKWRVLPVAIALAVLAGSYSGAPLGALSVAELATPASGGEMRESALIVGNLNFGPTDGILRYDGTGAFIDTMIPDGTAGLNGPCCMAFGPDDNLYVSNPFGGGVLRFNGLTGEFIDHFIPPGTGGLVLPLILVFHNGLLYVGDPGSHAIRRYSAGTGEFVDTFVQDDPSAPMMGLWDPQHFAFGPDDNLYVAAEYSNRVLRYDGNTGALMDQFLSADSGLTRPSGLTFGPDGLLYVGSVDMNEVRRYDVRTVGMGEVFVPAGSGGLSLPVGIAFGPDGNLYATSVGTAEILRYNGRTGESMGAFVSSGAGGLAGPRTLAFKSTVTVCHRPPGKPANGKTMTIGYLSGLDHVAHGDTIGACN